MKCSGKLLVTVMGIILSGSVGFGGILNVDGLVDPAEYDISITDLNDLGTESFVLTGADIKSLHWGIASGPGFPGDPTDVWYTIGMTVKTPPITTTDFTGLYPRPTSVHLGMSEGGTDRHSFDALMFFGNVLDVYMWDITAPVPAAITLDSTSLKYKINTTGAATAGLEIAIKTDKFTKLSPASSFIPFSFELLFDVGDNDVDYMQGTIPEPTTMSIFVVGGLFTLVRRRRAKR